jgi:hypothetical protein
VTDERFAWVMTSSLIARLWAFPDDHKSSEIAPNTIGFTGGDI